MRHTRGSIFMSSLLIGLIYTIFFIEGNFSALVLDHGPSFVPLANLLAHYQSCVLHFVKVQDTIDYEKIPIPFSITDPRHVHDTGTDAGGILKVKVVSLRCSLFIIDIGQLATKGSARRKLQASGMGKGGGSIIASNPWRVTPQHLWVLACEIDPTISLSVILTHLHLENLIRMLSMPKVHLLVAESDGGKGSAFAWVRGHFLCWYCGKPERYYPYNNFAVMSYTCPIKSNEDCHGRMNDAVVIATRSRSISIIKGMDSAQDRHSYFDSDRGSMTASSHLWKDAAASIDKLAIDYAVYGFRNVTQERSHQNFDVPRVYTNILNRSAGAGTEDEDGTMYLYSKSEPLTFITSHNVFPGHVGVNTYLLPFRATVWIAIAATVTLVMLVICVVHRASRDHSVAATYNLKACSIAMTTTAALAEHAEMWSAVIRTTPFRLAISLLWMSWLIASVVITNAYKGCLKSDFTLSAEVTTNWTSVEQMGNFPMYMVEPDVSCEHRWKELEHPFEKDRRRAGKYFLRCICSRADPETASKLMTCRFLNILRTLHSPYYSQQWCTDQRLGDQMSRGMRNRDRTIEALSTQTSYLCPGNQTRVYNLTREGPHALVAFLVERKRLPEVWPMFEAVSALDPNVNFVYVHEPEAGNLRVPKGFVVIDGLNSQYRWIHNGFGAMSSSGLYWFWEKLHSFRDLITGLKLKESQSKGYGQEDRHRVFALSLNHDGFQTFLVFVAFGVLIDCGVFVAEIMITFCGRCYKG